MSKPQRVVPGERRVIQTDAGIIDAGPAGRATATHLSQFGVDCVVNKVFKNTVPDVDVPVRVDVRVMKVWNVLADRVPKEQPSNLIGNVLIKSGDAEPAVAK